MAKPVTHAVVNTAKINANINGQQNILFIMIRYCKIAPAPASQAQASTTPASSPATAQI